MAQHAATTNHEHEHQADIDRLKSRDKRPTKQQWARLDDLTTKSAKIRLLTSWGFTRQEISRLLDIKYQHVRNVQVMPLPKSWDPKKGNYKEPDRSGGSGGNDANH